jgi:ABC-type transporter Mla maintaining outer membrane lipid asymmetry ATPase subunit MlaF
VSRVAIEFRNVVKNYQALRPLRVAALDVAEQQRVSITGLDRAGAELFVNLVNGAVLPDQGEVRVFGKPTQDIASDTEWLVSLDRFGVLTERAVLLEGSTLAQNLALPFTLDIDPMPPDVRARVEVLARETELAADRLDRPVGDAPPAVRLRVHLARALAIDPRVLLLEHPTASLGAADVPSMAALVRGLAEARRLTVVALSADRGFCDVVAEQAWVLNPATGRLSSARGWRSWISG